MALAIKRVDNLPHHLRYVSTLSDVTQKPKRHIDEPKQGCATFYSARHTHQIIEYAIAINE